jgi:hypothetical protein
MGPHSNNQTKNKQKTNKNKQKPNKQHDRSRTICTSNNKTVVCLSKRTPPLAQRADGKGV